MGFNLEKMILAEAVKAGHIRLKDLTDAGVLSQTLTQISKEEEEKLLTRMVTDGEFTIDSLQSKGILNQETIVALMDVIFDEEDASSLSLAQPGSENSIFSHYANLEPAGMGAMAKVYKAYDLNLHRYVALKVLKVSDLNLIQRFIREARSQAQIEHPNICKIYEAGEFQGRSFIAMQYINGKTLKEMSGELSVEVKIDLMRQIAEAVHEAHRKNLIHRDLKPANLMVEEKDGALFPYVVDFGLVREAGAPGLTQTDILMGSPYYMSPEQASGKVHSLDRRTDIYSLGVTLYELFSGTLPFVAEDNIVILRKIVEQDPAPLRKANRFIARDLETIILKCLEKDPEKRYDTAKDLSQDLQRYIKGETIHAKPSTFLYRLSKKAKKNKQTVAVIGLAFLLVCIFAWIGIQSRVTAQKQMVVVQQFGEDVNQVESMMRIARMRPLHDISAEQEMARKRIEQIGQQAKKLGTVAFAPGEYAMGKGYFVLQDYEKARQHLETAWRNGYRRSNAASILGQTFVALYQEKLNEIDKITDKKAREQQRKSIEKAYRDPALRYLKLSTGTTDESQEFIEALIAYVEQRFDVALKKAASSYARNGSLYEAKKIEADVHLELARALQDAGDYRIFITELLQAEKDYLEAITVGRSDASLYRGISSLKLSMMHLEIYYQGGNPVPHFTEAVRFSYQALQVNSKDVRARELLAQVNAEMADYERRNGRNPNYYIGKALEIVETSLAIKPSVELFRIMASANLMLAWHQRSSGQDERPSLQKSIQAAQKALHMDSRSELSLNVLGLAYGALGVYDAAHGQDPRSNFEQGIKAHQRALEINPMSERRYSNLAVIFDEKAAYEFSQDQDARETAQKAIEAYKKAITINPKAATTWSNLGNVYMSLGVYETEHGGNSRPSFVKALESHTKAQEITPNLHQPYNNMAAAYTALASYEIMKGLNPTETLRKAIENCEKALKVRPNYDFAYINLGTSYRYLAESQKKNPGQNLKKAEEAYAKSLELSPKNPEALIGRGNVALAEAEWRISLKKNPTNAFSKTQKDFDEVIRTNPENVEALIGLAELHHWHAEWLVKTNRSPSKEVQAGLEIINKILSTHPQMAKAFAVQGVLYLIQSNGERNATEKTKLLDQSRQSLEKALHLNRNLTKEYFSYVEEGKKLFASLK